MRGILIQTLVKNAGNRFNPAYAGNIISNYKICFQVQVQPRVCGEYKEEHRQGIPLIGSTPRMRGICSLDFANIINARFNPAYAGNMSAYLNFEYRV